VSDDRPIIVGGCHRSGTSLVRRILDSHPRIYCGPEVKFFRDFRGDYIQDPIRHVRFMKTARAMLGEEELLEVLGAAFVTMHERAARVAGKQRWADKVPENVVFLEEWRRLLGEDWVFLHVVRNPLDTLASIKEEKFPVSIPPGLDERIALYLEYARAGLDFRAANEKRYVRILYEDLVAQPEQSVRDLMAELGEEFDPCQLDVNARPHQVGLEDRKVADTNRIHRESIGRWPVLLTAAERDSIVEATAEIWARLDAAGRHPLPKP
jgi:hypothetical protein